MSDTWFTFAMGVLIGLAAGAAIGIELMILWLRTMIRRGHLLVGTEPPK